MFKRNGFLHIASISFSLFVILIIGLYQFAAGAQNKSDTEGVLKKIADAVLEDASFQLIDQVSEQIYLSVNEVPLHAILKLKSPYNDWRYWNGILNIALIRLGETLNQSSYTEFALKNISFTFDNYKHFENRYNDEGKWNYPFGQFFTMEELDDCGAMGASVIEAYHLDKQSRYNNYISKAAEHISNKQARLEDGTFVRSFPFKWTLWADDLYMSISFLSRMGKLTGENKYFDDAVKQVVNFHKYLFNDEKGLMYHCWYSDTQSPGVAFWGRANGWALLAQADLLDHLPENHKQRDELISLFKKHILGISRYQSGDGLWHQLLDKEDSYLETSCTAMFTYVIARGVNKGYIEQRHATIAERGWEGILSRIHPDGQIEGVCAGTAVSDNLVDYYNRPTPLNDIHGIGAVMLAGSEMFQLLND